MPRIPVVAPARRAPRIVLLLLASLVWAGCYTRHPEGWQAPEPVYVTVMNDNPLDMTIYAVHEGMRIRLGMVTTASKGHFTLKPAQLGGDGTFQLYADPIGSNRGLYSDRLYVSPGQVVEWTLAAVLPQSSLVVRDTT